MKTKELIKEKGLHLFNSRGIMAVTLRDVAKAIHKSYGNITYYYPKKEDLIIEFYFDMAHELVNISKKIFTEPPSLESLLLAPHQTFNVSFKYSFLFKDYVALMRTYPILAKTVKESNEQRKSNFLSYLLALQNLEYLHAHLRKDDFHYLMELSGAMRTFFFLQNEYENLPVKEQKEYYVDYVNRLLYPYLSARGQRIYSKLEAIGFVSE